MKRFFIRFSVFLVGLIVISSFFQFATEKSIARHEATLRKKIVDPPFIGPPSAWVDSVFNTLSLSDQIAQFMMVAAYSNRGPEHKAYISGLIKKYKIGGLIFFQGSPYNQALLTNSFQQVSEVPLMIAMDAEWGLAMRLDSTINYPRQMMLGAIQDEKLIYTMGEQLAEQMRLLGVHINFAPVVDVNNNPDNPVIGSRSFGEEYANVARKGLWYMKGLQDHKVIAVAKHFPGHGDTDTDSHLALPVISHERSRLDSVELFPFKELILSGVSGVMIAHLNVPALDPEENQPSTLSPLIVDSLLKNEMKFKGLVFTDAMNMGGVTRYYKPGEASVKAALAGNDILLMPDDVGKAISLIQKEVRRGNISKEEIETRCKKVLAAKYWLELDKNTMVQTDSLTYKLNVPKYEILNRKLTESAITVIESKNELIPLQRLDTLKIAAVAIGSDKPTLFQETLNMYLESDLFSINKSAAPEQFTELLSQLKAYNLVIVGLHNTDMRASRNFGITPLSVQFIDSLILQNKVLLDVFASPYALATFSNLKSTEGLMVSYEDNENSQSLSAQIIFGAIGASARLPVSIGNSYRAGEGINTFGGLRLKYSIPEEAGFDRNILDKIDSIAQYAIDHHATPGCQVLVARDGIVVFQKSYGQFTYSKKRPEVKNTDIYDLASLTKIAATMPVIMHLEEEGDLKLNDKLSEYLPYLDTTNKKDISIKDILLHQAGLKSWIPFYVTTLEPLYPSQDYSHSRYSASYPIKMGRGYYVNKHLKYKDGYFSDTPSEEYSVQVADRLFMNKNLIDSIYTQIAISEVSDTQEYKYSDLGFYLLQQVIEKLTRTSLNNFVDSFLYKPLGASTLGYLPLQRFDKTRIAPTENDLVFRKQIVHGYVHDPGAAMLGGVAGHAGLFSDANDLAKLMQMYLNRGEYGGQKFYKGSTINSFTKKCPECNNGNRRGMGFDKPQPDSTKSGPTIFNISPESYGHTGFTGTMAWVDPEENIVYIFLSNRVYPDAVENTLVGLNTRTAIQQVIYDALKQD
ncbi:MAG: serine hydrolase [Bacteroidales bacterium]|nr:serine hydrolase [Bacteroidales bacterium]